MYYITDNRKLQLPSQGGEAIGTIVPRYNANFTSTSEGKNYLLCDGSTYDTTKYPKLYAVLRTNVLPNLMGRVLWGSNTGGTYLAAGLPNITGTFFTDDSEYARFFTGAFKFTRSLTDGPEDGSDAQAGMGSFNASWSNAIYGASNTVQPPAMTVRFYIRAK